MRGNPATQDDNVIMGELVNSSRKAWLTLPVHKMFDLDGETMCESRARAWWNQEGDDKVGIVQEGCERATDRGVMRSVRRTSSMMCTGKLTGDCWRLRDCGETLRTAVKLCVRG